MQPSAQVGTRPCNSHALERQPTGRRQSDPRWGSAAPGLSLCPAPLQTQAWQKQGVPQTREALCGSWETMHSLCVQALQGDSNSTGDFTAEDVEAQRGGALIPEPVPCTLLGAPPSIWQAGGWPRRCACWPCNSGQVPPLPAGLRGTCPVQRGTHRSKGILGTPQGYQESSRPEPLRLPLPALPPHTPCTLRSQWKLPVASLNTNLYCSP